MLVLGQTEEKSIQAIYFHFSNIDLIIGHKFSCIADLGLDGFCYNLKLLTGWTQMKSKKTFLTGSLLLSLLIILTAVIGLTNSTIYSSETANWRVQALAQDIFDGLILAPMIIASAYFSFKKKIWAFPVWIGSLFYSIYTYSIYAFTINFGLLFPVYVLILGFSFYLLLFTLITADVAQLKNKFKPSRIRNLLAIFLIFFGGFFYLVWGSEIIQALMNNEIPASIIETGLITNPVHVLDMAFLLPAMIISGILLKSNNKFGYLFAPAVLTTKALFTLTIILINLEFKRYGLETNQVLIIIFSFIFGLDLLILLKYLHQTRQA